MIGIGYKIGALAVVLSIIYLGYRHYDGLLDDITTLEKNAVKLELAIELEKATVRHKDEAILEWQIAAEEFALKVEEANVARERAVEESRRLHEIFGKHDFTRLARAKPGRIESRINAGTRRVFAILTCETTTPDRCDSDGNPITEEAEPSTFSAILEWQIAAEEFALKVEEANVARERAVEESRRLHEIFGKHDFTRLARAKPGRIESRINAGTRRVFAILTCETTTPDRCDSDGNPITEEAEPSTSATDSTTPR